VSPELYGKTSLNHKVLYILSPVVVLGAWEAAARTGLIDARFFVPPSKIVVSLWELTKSGALWTHTWHSLLRVFWGTLIGAVPALLLALLMGFSGTLRAFMAPLVSATYPIPKIAILPFFLLIFGIGDLGKVMVVAVGVFYLVLINTLQGIMTLPRTYFEVARVFNISRRGLLFQIVLPGTFPYVFAGLRLGIGLGLTLVVMAEFIGAQEGLGFLIWHSWQTFNIDEMFVGLIVIALCGWAIEIVLEKIERRLMPWRGA
jgi:ABC-type nitrate/sulfonate/bicarbonate transport system permease component